MFFFAEMIFSKCVVKFAMRKFFFFRFNIIFLVDCWRRIEDNWLFGLDLEKKKTTHKFITKKSSVFRSNMLNLSVLNRLFFAKIDITKVRVRSSLVGEKKTDFFLILFLEGAFFILRNRCKVSYNKDLWSPFSDN